MSARWIPVVGLRIESGMTKSEVSITFALKSIDSPWGENCFSRMFKVPATSSGHSWIMSKFASVSMSRPGLILVLTKAGQCG